MALTRKLFTQLKEQAHTRKISLVLGARQVGKTTLLREIFDHLSVRYKCLFLDVEILSQYEKVSSFEQVVATLKLQGYDETQTDFFYLFLDEFQKYPALTIVLKNVYDHLPNVKIYASGSSSLVIKNQIQESLAGRKIITELYPLDFEEFLWFCQEERLAQNLKNIQKLQGDSLVQTVREYQRKMEEFMIFGGYPEVVLQQLPEEKKQVLASIFDLYVKKDLVEYLNVEKILNVKRLIEFLALNNGQKIKYEEIGAISSLPFIEVKRYIEVLRETYLIDVVRPYYKNKNKELIKIPKIYFMDMGVRNYFIHNFNELHLREDTGFLFETFVLTEFIKSGWKEITFWQNKNFQEVDFVVKDEMKLKVVEVKFKTKLHTTDLIGLQVFMKSYPAVSDAFLVNLSRQEKEKKIYYILPYTIASLNNR